MEPLPPGKDGLCPPSLFLKPHCFPLTMGFSGAGFRVTTLTFVLPLQDLRCNLGTLRGTSSCRRGGLRAWPAPSAGALPSSPAGSGIKSRSGRLTHPGRGDPGVDLLERVEDRGVRSEQSSTHELTDTKGSTETER